MAIQQFNFSFEEGEVVYLKTDPEQLPRIVFGYNIISGVIRYGLVMGSTEASYYLDVEISREENELGLEVPPENVY